MTKPVPLPTIQAVIGQSVRQLRDEHGVTQERVATAARDWGLNWSRSKVAALERGDKAISGAELFLLPFILRAAGCGAPSVLDLLPDGPVWIKGYQHTLQGGALVR